MARYLHWYNDKEDFEENYWGGNYVEPWVSITVDGEKRQTDFDRKDYKELFKTPLTFEFSEGGEFYFYYDAITDEYKKTVTYSLNGGPKVQVTPTSENTITVAVEQGDVIQVWGDNETYSHRINSSENAYFFFGSDCEFDVSGNIMSLIRSNGFEKLFSFSRETTFSHLFFNCGNLSRADKLILPAIELTDRCYESMFAGCTSLSQAPELPATTLADYCYGSMFKNCTSLSQAPELPATTLADYCYCEMFWGCTHLATAPELPATTLANNCYQYMFYDCRSLTSAPALPATALAEACYYRMFYGCASLTTAPELPATTLARSCYSGMFYDCKSFTTAPKLPVTTLAEHCYGSMFSGCKSLTTAPELPATTLVEGCYFAMFNNCASLTSAPALPATTLAKECYYSMFKSCTGLTTAPVLPATTLVESCYRNMFYGCTSLTTAPELPATTLADYCYNSMFNGCRNLNYVKCLATNISASNALQYWLSDVSTTGTFVKAASMSSWPTGVSGIPNNWTVESYTLS